MSVHKEHKDEQVMVRANQLYTEYITLNDTLIEALMDACIKLAKLEFADNARLGFEKYNLNKYPEKPE
jgi:hypothetical protein